MALSPHLAHVLGNDGALRRRSALLEDHALGTRSAEFVPLRSEGLLRSQALDPSGLSAYSSNRLDTRRDRPDVSQTHEQADRESETGAGATTRRGTGDH